jgi:hypothetical protein
MFSAYDHWRRIRGEKIHVPMNEIRQIISDSLRVQADALGSEGGSLSDYHLANRIAEEVITEFQFAEVVIDEHDFGVMPFCADCLEAA